MEIINQNFEELKNGLVGERERERERILLPVRNKSGIRP